MIAELRKFATDRGDDLAALFVEGVDAVVTLLRDFGQSLFERGRSLGNYCETINAVAGLRRGWRSLLTAAWDLVSEWQMYEPVDHHVPLPKVVFRAGIAVVSSARGAGPRSTPWSSSWRILARGLNGHGPAQLPRCASSLQATTATRRARTPEV